MSRALPPVGWQSIIEHDPHSTVVCACEKTVVMLKQPGHLTSMKKELGDCTNRLSLCFRFSSEAEGWRRSRTMVFGGRVYSPGDLRGRWGSAGGSWRLLAAQRAEKSLVSQTKATEAPSLRFVALRRPALAVGRGVVPAVAARARFLGC